MSKKKYIIDTIQKSNKSLSDNIDAIRHNNNQVKAIIDLKNGNEMLLRFVDAIPDDLIELKGDNIVQTVKTQYEFNQTHIPTIPMIQAEVVPTSTGLSLSGCVMALDIMDYQIQTDDTPLPEQYPILFREYETYQNDQDKLNNLHSILSSINVDLANIFDEMITWYKKYSIDLIDAPSFANYMRNFIYKFQGEFKSIINSKNNLNEQKFKWHLLCDYLAKNGVGSIEHSQLLTMKNNYDYIIDELSKIGKDRINTSKHHIQILYNTIIGFIESIFKLISFQ